MNGFGTLKLIHAWSLTQVLTTVIVDDLSKHARFQYRLKQGLPKSGKLACEIILFNRIYNKILDRDWFSARLFVT